MYVVYTKSMPDIDALMQVCVRVYVCVCVKNAYTCMYVVYTKCIPNIDDFV